MKVHLNELVQINSQLLQAMEKCCSEDVRVHHILGEKSNKLQVSCSKVKGVSPGFCQVAVEERIVRKAGALRERTNEISSKAEKSGKSWINELKDL